MHRTLKRVKLPVDGNRTGHDYYPRFRPRRLVMPVDTNDVHAPRRFGNPLHQKYIQQARLRRAAEQQGAIKLSSVPAERTVGDAFRIMLQTCESNGFFEPSRNFTPASLIQLEHHLEAWDRLNLKTRKPGPSAGTPRPTPKSSSILTSFATSSLSVRDIDQMWSILDRTPLNAPVHGLLALRGKALVEGLITTTSYALYPRLRSKHVQQLLHETAGLLPCSRVAVRLGFAALAGVEAEVGMWRELNTLQQRLDVARRKAAAHLQRVEKGIAVQRRWYWKAVLRAASGRLRMFPVSPGDLFPRMEWIRSFIFAFIGFLEMAERAADAQVKVKPLVLKLFCAQLGEFAHTRDLLHRAEACLKFLNNKDYLSSDSSLANDKARRTLSNIVDAIQHELNQYLRQSSDESDVTDAKSHPLNDRADRRREQFESSGGAVATQTLRDEIFDDYQIKRHHRDAPPILLNALRTNNALKEVQLILKYAPGVSPALRNSLIDVDPVIQRTVEIHETNNYATLHNAQQYRQVEYTVCRLYAGTQAIGEGKGETLIEAINEAAQHTLLNYYVRGAMSTETGKDIDPNLDFPSREQNQSVQNEANNRSGTSETVQVREPQIREEIVF